jgi:uncharacterized phiE125 gp8 family phage protein
MRPLTLDNIKSELKVETSDDDALLTSLVTRAIRIVEDMTHVCLRPVDVTISRESLTDFLIPLAPLRSVAAVKYIQDSDGTEVTLSADSWYATDVDSPFTRIRFRGSLPRDVRPGTVKVYLSVGSDTLPDGLVPAIVGLVGHLYNNPEATAPIALQDVPLSFRALIQLYARHGSAL